MTKLSERRPAPAPRHASTRARSARLILYALAAASLAGATHAADLPAQTPPPGITASDAAPVILPAPAQALTTMADSLDKDADFVVANVAGQPITKGDVADIIRATPINLGSLGYKALFTRAMDQLLRENLAAAAGREAGLDKDPMVLRREKSAATRILAEAWLDHQAGAAVSDKALHARYDREIAGKPGPEEVRARVILVATEAQARDLIAKIQAGADFADLARQFSKDMSAEKGGDVGYIPLEALGPEVGAVMFALGPGQITQYPVRSLPGYFIVRIEGRKQRTTPTFDEARDGLASELRREAAAAAIAALTADINVKGSGTAGNPAPAPGGKLPSR